MEGKTNFSKRLKQFDGLTWLTPTFHILRQIYATDSAVIDRGRCHVQVLKLRAEQFGPIYKEKIGNIVTVIVSDLDEYDKVIAVDGRYPNRFEMLPIVHYRRKRGMGLGTVNGSLKPSLQSINNNNNNNNLITIAP